MIFLENNNELNLLVLTKLTVQYNSPLSHFYTFNYIERDKPKTI